MTHLPRDGQRLVEIFGFEEAINVLLHLRLELLFQYDVRPIGLLYIGPEGMIFLPIVAVVDENFLVQLGIQAAGSYEQGPRGFFRPLVQDEELRVPPKAIGILRRISKHTSDVVRVTHCTLQT